MTNCKSLIYQQILLHAKPHVHVLHKIVILRCMAKSLAYVHTFYKSRFFNFGRQQKYPCQILILAGTNFRGLTENDTFVGFKIHGHSIFLRN